MYRNKTFLINIYVFRFFCSKLLKLYYQCITVAGKNPRKLEFARLEVSKPQYFGLFFLG